MKHRGQCLTCAPPAWDYPPRGGSRLSCGCWQPYPHSAEELISHGDGDDVITGSYCPFCAIRIKTSGGHIETHEPELAA